MKQHKKTAMEYHRESGKVMWENVGMARTRESLTRTMHETCFYCDGTGQIQSRTTIAYEILRQIRRERSTLSGYSVLVNAHPAVVDLMQGEEKAAVVEAEPCTTNDVKLASCAPTGATPAIIAVFVPSLNAFVTMVISLPAHCSGLS